MFTDIVASTEQLAVVGDQRWKQLLDEHDGLVDRTVARYGGRVVKTLGDGVLATFDGPPRGCPLCGRSPSTRWKGVGSACALGSIPVRSSSATPMWRVWRCTRPAESPP